MHMTASPAPQPDLRLPLYQRLRDEIAHQIARNVWRSGEPIPTEAELAASHGVAVGTVRKAIDLLVADGLVERQQGRGTFVRRPRFDRSLFRFFRHLGPDGLQAVPEGRILGRETRPAPGAVRDALGLGARAEAIRLRRVRLLDGRPILSEEIWLPADRFAALLDTSLEEIGDLLYPAYERLRGHARPRHPRRNAGGGGGTLGLRFRQPPHRMAPDARFGGRFPLPDRDPLSRVLTDRPGRGHLFI